MSSRSRFREVRRDVQDGTERHVWGEQTHNPGSGSIISVRGTGTADEEAPVINGGASFNLAKNSNAEVFLLSGGSDTNMKFAILTLPRDKQRPWKEGTGGVQHPGDPDHALEFNSKRAHITKEPFAIGETGLIEVIDGKVYIRGPLVVEGQITSNTRVIAPNFASGTEPIPEFEK